MPGPRDDDREAVDRAFADLVAGFHLTADRPEPQPDLLRASEQAPGPAATSTDSETPDASWADHHPLFRYPDPPLVDGEPETEERFVPEPLMPLTRPTWPVLVGWLAMGYALLAVLATALGAQLPRWVGWLALISFIGGFGLLVSRLPRDRPPDAGNGAVL